jgi:hypothetical protein
VDVGPAIYLARAFETDIDTVVKFFIFILIFVFDPLAVALVVAYNVAITGNRKWEVYGEKKRKEIIDESFTKYESHREDFKPKDKVIFKGDEKTFVTTDNLSKGGRKVV